MSVTWHPKKKLAQRVIDYDGETTGYRSAVYHGRSTSFHGSYPWISRREYAPSPFTVAKAERDDEYERGLDA